MNTGKEVESWYQNETRLGRDKNTLKTPLARIDYQENYQFRLPLNAMRSSITVVYNASVTRRRLSRFWFVLNHRAQGPIGLGLVTSTRYCIYGRALAESFRLSHCSDRHFYTHLWPKVSIKRYGRHQPRHQQLSELAAQVGRWLLLSCPSCQRAGQSSPRNVPNTRQAPSWTRSINLAATLQPHPVAMGDGLTGINQTG